MRVALVDGVPDLDEVIPDGEGVPERFGVVFEEAAGIGLETVCVESFVAAGGQESAVFCVCLKDQPEQQVQCNSVGEGESGGVEWDAGALGEALGDVYGERGDDLVLNSFAEAGAEFGGVAGAVVEESVGGAVGGECGGGEDEG